MPRATAKSPDGAKPEKAVAAPARLAALERLRMRSLGALAWCVGWIDASPDGEVPQEVRDTLRDLQAGAAGG